MLEWTDRHQRMLMRCITRRALLYTEMVTPSALARDTRRHLAHHPREHPVALQLGGSDPAEMARAAHLGQSAGFVEINLNLGCPSSRVGAGRFGATLMKAPRRAAAVVRAMVEATSVPVTVKLRIGVDERDRFDHLLALVDELHQAGARTFIVHARKAWLQGLSPKENREIPPLRHQWVLALKAARPELEIILNGGLQRPEAAHGWLEVLDGVMVGRAAYHYPARWLTVDPLFFQQPPPANGPLEVLQAYLPYLREELSRGTPLAAMARHLLPLFHGLPGARRWRRHLSRHMHRRGADETVVMEALGCLGV